MACNMQAEYSQSHLSRQQLEQCLDGFQLKLSGKARAADAQRRNILLAKAIHFLQPQDVQVSLVAMYGVLSRPGHQHDSEYKGPTQEHVSWVEGSASGVQW